MQQCISSFLLRLQCRLHHTHPIFKMLRLETLTLFVLCILLQLDDSTSVTFERFSGGYDRTCVTFCSMPWFCGHELFLRTVDTKITNLTITRNRNDGRKHHCDTRNLSMTLTDVNENRNLSENDDSFMVVSKESTFVVCEQEKLGITLKQKANGVRYVSLIANVSIAFSKGRLWRTIQPFNSVKFNSIVCEYKGRPANWHRATANKLVWSWGKRIAISAIGMLLTMRFWLFLADVSENRGLANLNIFASLAFCATPYTFALFFVALFPPTVNGRYERILEDCPLQVIFISTVLVVVLLLLFPVFVCLVGRIKSNPVEVTVGWIIGIGATMVTAPFLGALVAIACGLSVAEIVAQCAIRSRRLLIGYNVPPNNIPTHQSNSNHDQLY